MKGGGMMHGPMHGAGKMHGPMHAGMHQGTCPLAPILGKADATVQKVKDGAVLKITSKDPTKVAEIQAAAQHIAEHITAGQVPAAK